MKKLNKIFNNLNNEFIEVIDNINKNIYVLRLKKTIQEDLFLKLKKVVKPKVWIEQSQEYIERKLTSDQEVIVLNQSRYWARAITWSLMGGTTFFIGWLAIAKTEEIVVTQGKLEPSSGVIEVQMPFNGVAREILIKEGEEVKKGQILIKLDTEVTTSTNNYRKKSLALNTNILNKFKTLLKEGAISELQYLQQEDKVAQIKSEITESEVTLKYQEVKAPINGLIFDLKPKSPGFVATGSEPVLKIVPLGDLKANVEINSTDIGFVNTGKKAEISIDSFPASDFGILEGTVTRIGSDALPPMPELGKGLRFPAEITLKSQYLKIKNGNSLPLQTGMSLTANIKLRKVSYLQLLLSNFQQKTDSLREL